MTELKLVRGAAGWLRKLGAASVALLVSFALALTSFLNAESSSIGADSEIDYAASLSATSTATTFLRPFVASN
jgi:hypothetical protein